MQVINEVNNEKKNKPNLTTITNIYPLDYVFGQNNKNNNKNYKDSNKFKIRKLFLKNILMQPKKLLCY